MNFIQIIIGAVLVALAVALTIVAILRTPRTLRGYYGVMYVALAVAAGIGGAALVTFGVLSTLIH